MASQVTPRIRSRPESRSVMFLVLQKAMTRSKPPISMRRTMASTFSFRSTSRRYWLMSGLFCSSARTVISTGSRWYTQEMSITSREMVAEKRPRFRRWGIRSRMRVTSRMKPMSSIRSASSSTTVSTWSRRTVRRFTWSIRRPGVATTIWGLFFNCVICLSMGCPPYRHTVRTPSLKAHRSRSSSRIWMASSRVGASTRASTSLDSGSMCSTMGMPKAKVLPVPVGALAITSLYSIK